MSRDGIIWEDQVVVLAQLYGWKVASFDSVRIQRRDGSCYWATPVKADGRGWPDLVLVRGETILFRELKTGKARTTGDQREWLEALKWAGCNVGVWRPADLEAIVIELSRVSPHDQNRRRQDSAVSGR